jgi:DNA-directed RNA polymerase specialized sigma24 family protein
MMLKNETRNYLRGQTYRQTKPMVNEEGEFLDFRNPEEFLEIAQELTPAEIRRMFNELDQVGKDSRGSAYLKLLLEGYSQTDISRQLGVSVPAVSQWLSNNKQTIKGILHKYLAA